MKSRWILAVLLAGGLAAGLIFANLEMSKDKERERQREKTVVPKPRISLGEHGEVIVALDLEMQKRIGLRVERLTATRISAEFHGYGQLLDPAPLAAQRLERVSAQAALSASAKEFERLKLLNEQQKNASDRAVQAAEAAARRDGILVEANRTRLMSGWGKALADRPDLEELIRSLVSRESVLLRINLPAGETVKETPQIARIVPLSGDGVAYRGELAGPVSAVDSAMQGQGFLFLVRTNTPGLIPGAAVTGYLEIPGEALDGVVVPDSAVVRHEGRGWVYIQTGEETFARREIALEHRRDNGWFVKAGARANERLVINEAQALLSEEQKYQIRMVE